MNESANKNQSDKKNCIQATKNVINEPFSLVK